MKDGHGRDAWLAFLGDLIVTNDKKIVVMSFDGLGDAPYVEGKTVLEAAHIPNLDTLASRSALGLADPVGPGITPGSGPGHLAIFGYDPIATQVGRGVLSALGVGFDLEPGDVAARGNFCTVDPTTGQIKDRRAGRIPTDLCKQLVERLSQSFRPTGIDVFIRPEREHRFVLVLRGKDLIPEVTDTDPQQEGVQPMEIRPLTAKGNRLAEVVTDFVTTARTVLAEEQAANMVLLRGFDTKPKLPLFPELYRLHAAAFAVYPMYRGLAKLVGMDVYAVENKTAKAFTAVRERWDQYDYFFVHIKKTDSYGEDGNFEGKVRVLEQTDRYLPRVLGLNPDVMVVTGDHSTPALLRGHSWHPVPFLLYSRYTRYLSDATFDEATCARGSLGRFPMRYAMSMILANALKLKKYGA